MLKIKIISVGKIKEKAVEALISELQKRVGRYCTFESVIIDDLPVKDKPNHSDIEAVLKKESNKIFKNISTKAFTVSMCIEGKRITSEGFSTLICNLSMRYPEIDFIIGSSHGLCEDVKNASSLLLSMSDMTFPHNIARLMLTEQIYRAFKIAANESYHK